MFPSSQPEVERSSDSVTHCLAPRAPRVSPGARRAAWSGHPEGRFRLAEPPANARARGRSSLSSELK